VNQADASGAQRVRLKRLALFQILLRLSALTLVFSQDLHGRCAGRNADDVSTVLSGVRAVLQRTQPRET
jgi:hypothetical protein